MIQISYRDYHTIINFRNNNANFKLTIELKNGGRINKEHNTTKLINQYKIVSDKNVRGREVDREASLR